MTGFGMGFGWIFLIIIIGVIIWAVVTMSNRNQSSGRTTPADESAEDVLKKRYARGEITEEEYEEMKQNLR